MTGELRKGVGAPSLHDSDGRFRGIDTDNDDDETTRLFDGGQIKFEPHLLHTTDHYDLKVVSTTECKGKSGDNERTFKYKPAGPGDPSDVWVQSDGGKEMQVWYRDLAVCRHETTVAAVHFVGGGRMMSVALGGEDVDYDSAEAAVCVTELGGGKAPTAVSNARLPVNTGWQTTASAVSADGAYVALGAKKHASSS